MESPRLVVIFSFIFSIFQNLYIEYVFDKTHKKVTIPSVLPYSVTFYKMY